MDGATKRRLVREAYNLSCKFKTLSGDRSLVEVDLKFTGVPSTVTTWIIGREDKFRKRREFKEPKEAVVFADRLKRLLKRARSTESHNRIIEEKYAL